MSDQYRFTLTDGVISDIFEFEHGLWSRETPDANELWALSMVDGVQVVTRTETEIKDGRTVVETSVFRDDDGDGIYLEVSETKTIDGVAVVDAEHGGKSSDRYKGSELGDRYFAGAGHDVLEGGIGSDYLRGDDGNDRLSGGLDDDDLDGGAGNDRLAGDAGNDHLTGASGSDQLFGGEGADALFGGNGNDVLSGDAGDDVLHGDAGNDQLRGGDGNDILSGGAGNDQLRGDKGNDWLVAGAGNDRLDGGDGDDLLDAGDGAGNDSYVGGSGVDTLTFAGTGSAVVVDLGRGRASGADSGRDSLRSVENVTGSGFADTLTGSAVANVLTGGAGADTLAGGKGADLFVFDNLAVGGADVVTDFSTLQGDTLGFDGLVFTALADGVAFASGTLADAALGMELVFDTASGGLYYDADGTGQGADAQLIVTLTGVTTLAATDIVVL